MLKSRLRHGMIIGALLLTAPRLHAQTNPDWTTPIAPFRIDGNLYYVGGKHLASYLIVTTGAHSQPSRSCHAIFSSARMAPTLACWRSWIESRPGPATTFGSTPRVIKPQRLSANRRLKPSLSGAAI